MTADVTVGALLQELNSKLSVCGIYKLPLAIIILFHACAIVLFFMRAQLNTGVDSTS